jgi:hypothetical protein
MSGLTRRVAALLALAVIAFTVPPARAQNEALGPLAAFVLDGRDGDWQGLLDDDLYILRNDGSRDGAVRYFFIDPPAGSGGADGWTAVVEVQLRPQNERAFAGLLVAYADAPRRYVIFARTGDGRAVVWRRSPEGIAVLAEGQKVRLGAELRVIVTGPRVIFLVDGALLAELDPATIGEGAVGIVAGGRGSFDFSGFALETVTVQASPESAPPAPVSETPPPLPSPAPAPDQPATAPSLGALGGGGPPAAPSLGALGGAPAN